LRVLKPYSFIILLSFCFFVPVLFAQELITDRPDQTESALTVPLHSLQVETGFHYETIKENGFRIEQYSIAGTLFRYGIEDNLEIRFGSGYFINKSSETTHNFDDLLAGIKINFLREESAPLDLGVMAHLIVPVFPLFRMRLLAPELIISGSRSLSDKISIGVNLGGSYNSQWTEINYLYTTVIGYSLTQKSGIFIEAYGYLSPKVNPSHYYDGGFTYSLSDFLQLDISGGKNISGIDSNWFISTGVSFRLND
jgi:hypothetical protein